MPRTKQTSRADVVLRAMHRFWRHGYHGSSMDDLVAATGSNRHALYAEFGGKHGLFLACLDAYQEAIITPAFSPMEKPDAGFAEIRGYFDIHMAQVEASAMPSPGCFVANTMTEIGPHNAEIQARVTRHFQRVQHGFAAALRNAAGSRASDRLIRELALFLTTSSQGMWSFSRSAASWAQLRQYVQTLVNLVERRLSETSAGVRTT